MLGLIFTHAFQNPAVSNQTSSLAWKATIQNPDYVYRQKLVESFLLKPNFYERRNYNDLAFTEQTQKENNYCNTCK